MNYKTIKMDYHYRKDRFNRTIMVREDINLIELGCAMCTAIRAEFEHNFLFIKNKKQYVPDCFIENGFDDYNEVPMKKYSLGNLGDKFQFWYDTGDDWLFDCKVYKKETKLVGSELAYLVDGKGQGVWEDNVWTLDQYFNGLVDPNTNEPDEEKGIYPPWNFEIEKYSDFDTAFNLAEEKEMFSAVLNSNIEMYLENCHLSGYELEVNPRTEEVLNGMYDDQYEDGVVNMRLNTMVMKLVDEQINNVDYIGAKYKELLEKYDDISARNLIGQVLVEEIFDVLKENKTVDQKAYERRIKNLK